MFAIRPSGDRGHSETPWLDSRHTFSFGSYYNPRYMGFSDLRVINDDVVAPLSGFGTHPHDNMEIVTVVLNGELEHQDSMGNRGIIKAGEIQKMSAGTGITHSEMNPLADRPVHFLQIWIVPNRQNIAPDYQQKKFDPKVLTNQLIPVVTPDGRDGSIVINQDAEIYQTLLEEDKTVDFSVTPERKVWVQVALGAVSLAGQTLIAGDGAAIAGENKTFNIRGIDPLSNILVFNLRK